VKLVFALGNTGSEYAGTRHNTGFIAIDAYAKSRKASFAEKAKFHAYIAELSVEGDKVLLVKPTTFYNEVGISARALIDFYKLTPSEDMLVTHDDLVLPLGTIRVRKKGSDAGNNGIKSLNAHIGQDYTRIRVGIHASERTDDTAFVLGKFMSDEMKTIKEAIIPKTSELIDDFILGKLVDASYKL
jgi:PTH1 family peptidyl-tRNA hydrolase